MQRAKIGGVELEYQWVGSGELVVLVHAGVFADWFEPLLTEPALTERFRVLTYHRVGYAGSSKVSGPLSLRDQATQLRELMRALNIDSAHLVGHSSGANIAMQLALDSPDMVRSLALLEPALPVGPKSATPSSRVAPALEKYRAGDKAGAVDAFLQMVAGPNYRAALDKALPDAFNHAVTDADTFFGQELPAVYQWTFTREEGSRITQPTLAVTGEKSPEVSPIWTQRQDMLLNWLPNAQPFELRGATHLLQVQNPQDLAAALAKFFAGN
jgi:pimeloyl-ACP methyl ester carboxylesterase